MDVSHSGSLITRRVHVVVIIIDKIRILTFWIWIWIFILLIHENDLRQQKIRGVSGIAQNLKSYVNAMCRENSSWLLFKEGKVYKQLHEYGLHDCILHIIKGD